MLVHDATSDRTVEQKLTAVGVLARHMHAESPVYRDAPFDKETVRALIAQVVEREDAVLVLSEHPHAGVVGFIAARCGETFFGPSLMSADMALYLDPRFRKGVRAAKLIQQYVGWARQRGVRDIRIGTTTGVDTQEVAQLYLRLGFRLIGAAFALPAQEGYHVQ